MIFAYIVFLVSRVVSPIQIGLMHNWKLAQNICINAISDARINGQCTQDYIEVVMFSGCDSSTSNGLLETMNLMQQRNGTVVSAFIGPQCEDNLMYFFEMGNMWKTPYVSFILSDPTSAPIFVSTAQFHPAPYLEILSKILRAANRTSITFFGPESSFYFDSSMAQTIYDYNLDSNHVQMSRFILLYDDTTYSEVEDVFLKAEQTLVFIADYKDPAYSLKKMRIKQLSELNFFIVVMFPIYFGASGNTDSTLAYLEDSNVTVISPIIFDLDSKYNIAKDLVSIDLADFTKYLWLYNACYTYCYGTTFGASGNLVDYASRMSNKQFTNKYGTYQFDSGGQMMTDYGVFKIDSNSISLKSRFNSFTTSCQGSLCFSLTEQPIDPLFVIGTDRIEACVAIDVCKDYTSYIVIGGILILIFLIATAAAVIYINNERNRLREMTESWKLRKDLLKIITNKNANQDTGFDADPKKGKKNKHASNEPKSEREVLATRRRAFAKYALVGALKCELIEFKIVKMFEFNDVHAKLWSDLKQLNNDNLAKFFGVCLVEGDNFYCLHILVERATLYEFSMDLVFAMDNTFKSAFMRDIVKGLAYLHKSNINYHGFLNTETCLIDTNWVLKLTNFGYCNLINDFFDSGHIKNVDALSGITNHQYSCYAPEHMIEYDKTGTLVPRMLRGSQHGDVFSLGYIFYEMCYRTPPYTNHRLPPAELVNIMMNNKRPDTPENIEEIELIQIMHQCWDRDPQKRPTLKKIAEVIDNVYPTSKGNLVDQMMKMNEKYAQNLENIVSERTAMLGLAQEQIMKLLNEMLPASIAEMLKAGKPVPPRSYDSATVLFVQLCDFQSLLNTSSPDEIIVFLNNVFGEFDVIIKQFDAYKVETTGETYMVASGVPEENGGRHIFEIAEISLRVREAAYSHRVIHLPSFKVRVRIGFHAGPIAAGVIGIRSPRYCLFGDTVNFASRMQSNCPPNQIQTSEPTARQLLESHNYKLVKRGIVHVKGKGEVNCYWLNEHIHLDAEGEEENEKTDTVREVTPAADFLKPPEQSTTMKITERTHT